MTSASSWKPVAGVRCNPLHPTRVPEDGEAGSRGASTGALRFCFRFRGEKLVLEEAQLAEAGAAEACRVPA